LPAAYIGATVDLPVIGGTFAPFPGGPMSPCPADLTGASAAIFTACTRKTVTGEISASESDLQLSAFPFGGSFPGLDQVQETATLEANLATGLGDFTLLFGWLRNDATLHHRWRLQQLRRSSRRRRCRSARSSTSCTRTSIATGSCAGATSSDPVSVILGAQAFSESSSLLSGSQFWLRNPASIFANVPRRSASAERRRRLRRSPRRTRARPTTPACSAPCSGRPRTS
jgi:hypothetical protein